MMTNKSLCLLIASTAAICAGASAQTITELSNINQPYSGNFQSGQVQYGATGALVFTTGSQSVVLYGISAEFTDVSPYPQTVNSGLYLAPSGAVGSEVSSSFTYNSATDSAGINYTFTPTAPVTLQANTEYAFVVGGIDQLDWFYSDSGTGYDTAAQGWSMQGFAQSFDQGNTWQPVTTGDLPAATIVATPEPASLALLGMGAVSLFAFRRRSN